MGRNRKTFTDTFKKEVAIEAIKEKNTVNEIAAKHGISGSMVSNWKKHFYQEAFQGSQTAQERECRVKQVMKKTCTELGKTQWS
jgi:putative transposase